MSEWYSLYWASCLAFAEMIEATSKSPLLLFLHCLLLSLQAEVDLVDEWPVLMTEVEGMVEAVSNQQRLWCLPFGE